jgi:hypothetical protein
VLNECLEALHDPQDPLAAALASKCCVYQAGRACSNAWMPGWAKIAPAAPKTASAWSGRSCHKHGSLSVHPVLQRLGKRGTWGRGQRLRLDELEQNQGFCARPPTARPSRD